MMFDNPNGIFFVVILCNHNSFLHAQQFCDCVSLWLGSFCTNSRSFEIGPFYRSTSLSVHSGVPEIILVIVPLSAGLSMNNQH